LPVSGSVFWRCSPYPTFFRPGTQFRYWLGRQGARLGKHARALVGKSWRESLVRAYHPRPFAGALCHFLPSREWAQGPFLGLRWKSVARHSEEHFGPDGASGDDMLLPQHAPAFAELFGCAYAKNIR
jgi:hypothetical protein